MYIMTAGKDRRIYVWCFQITKYIPAAGRFAMMMYVRNADIWGKYSINNEVKGKIYISKYRNKSKRRERRASKKNFYEDANRIVK